VNSSFLLVNTNVARPPVSPVGLEYVGEALAASGVPVQILDLSFESDWQAALARELSDNEPSVVGLAVRNTDDCCFATRRSFLPWISEVVTEVRRLSQAFIVLGGGGFSIMPDTVLKMVPADAGIIGDGEETAPALYKCLMNGGNISHLPNMIWRDGDATVRNSMANVDLRQLPLPRRHLFDNQKYEQMGAMVGVETKRGCTQPCIFCADPVAKGNRVRLRPPSKVTEEFQDLMEQGVSWFHLCDSEFNLPVRHAKEVCQAIIQAGLGDRMRWYCYCSPVPFDRELAGLMKRAGCAGINFGVDSLCDEQLSRLGRTHSSSDIRQLVEIVSAEGLNYMVDLLVGGPGENEDTVKTAIEQVKELGIPLIGVAIGVRVYQGTPLGKAIARGTIRGGLYPETGRALYEPLFYVATHIGGNARALVSNLVAGDPRVMFLVSPEETGSYNYADDSALCKLVEEGARGAYWDILRHSP